MRSATTTAPGSAPATAAPLPEELADLRYVNAAAPGFTRRRAGRGFYYLDRQGRITDPRHLARIKALVIPPAWTDVWICPQANGHIQATGRDEAGRKQYIYHPRWEEVRNLHKFNRMLEFGRALPGLRAQVDADLAQRGLGRQRVLAAVVRLLEQSLIRIGNVAYRSQNGTFGLTTLWDDHVTFEGGHMIFEFVGKSGKQQRVAIKDRRLARIVKQCEQLPGQHLFQYVGDDGQPYGVESGDVNDYLRAAMGQEYTAKDFRTWGGSVLAVRVLTALGPAEAVQETEKHVREAVKEVARQLGNTTAVCRQYYVHPAVFDAYRNGLLAPARADAAQLPTDSPYDLDDDEQTLMLLLSKQMEEEEQGRK
jgi:DNA topoisomerase-1